MIWNCQCIRIIFVRDTKTWTEYHMATKQGYVVVDVFGSHENAIDFSSFTNE